MFLFCVSLYVCFTRTAFCRNELPKELLGTMSEANSAYVAGELERAIELAKAIITKAADVPDSYTLLAMIYTEKGDYERALFYRKFEQLCLPVRPELPPILIFS